jgi:hypothetical protein
MVNFEMEKEMQNIKENKKRNSPTNLGRNSYNPQSLSLSPCSVHATPFIFLLTGDTYARVPLVSLTATWTGACAVASQWDPPVGTILFLSLSLLGVQSVRWLGSTMILGRQLTLRI